MGKRDEGSSRVVQNFAREVAAREGKRLNSCVAVNDTEASSLALEEDTVVVLISSDGPGFVRLSTAAREEQSSREPRASQVTRVDDGDNVRFRRHGPVLAARARMLALVPGVNAQTKSCHVASSQAQSQNAKPEDRFNKPYSKLSDWLQI
jgi:hypothetical protein